MDYPSAHIVDPVQDLPCARPCPPVSDTTDALRRVILRWLGEVQVPMRTLLCTPSKSTEAWVVAALYPTDHVARNGNLECHNSPANILAAKPAVIRLVRAGKKSAERYQNRAADIERSWPTVRALCSEAERFSLELLALIRTSA